LDYESINSLDQDYKRLLAVEKWDELFKEKEQRKIEEESMFLEDILKELQEEFGMYKDIRMAKEHEANTENSEFDDDGYIPVDKPVDISISIFGYKISEMPQNTKLIVGFSFLSVIMGIIYFLFYYVRKMKNNSSGRNKKKRY